MPERYCIEHIEDPIDRERVGRERSKFCTCAILRAAWVWLEELSCPCMRQPGGVGILLSPIEHLFFSIQLFPQHSLERSINSFSIAGSIHHQLIPSAALVVHSFIVHYQRKKHYIQDIHGKKATHYRVVPNIIQRHLDSISIGSSILSILSLSVHTTFILPSVYANRWTDNSTVQRSLR